jgi:hypothetical protein
LLRCPRYGTTEVNVSPKQAFISRAQELIETSFHKQRAKVMALINNSAASGKRQASGHGPSNGAHKKSLTAVNGAKSARTALGSAKGGASKSGKKGAAQSVPYSSLRSRQILLEKLRRQIWGSVAEINDAIVNAAKLGNLQAAKALFDFAGVYSLPEPSEEAAAAPLPVREVSEPEEARAQGPVIGEDVDPVDAFFCSIGMAPSAEEDQPAESELEVRMG